MTTKRRQEVGASREHSVLCGQDGLGGCTCGVYVSAARVSAFVDSRYQGVYCTYLVREASDGNRRFVTRLHTADGPMVHTAVRPDGSMLDITRGTR